MKLEHPFYRLPLRFDPKQLAREVSVLAEGAWEPHPQGFSGNRAVPLVVDRGRERMVLTKPLIASAYLRQVLASFQTAIGRCRLMRIDPRASVPEHTDSGLYWQRRVRIHVPVLTDPSVEFRCGEATVHMAAGEAWVFSNWHLHGVTNPIEAPRVHLVADTTGSARFWDLVDRASVGKEAATEPELVPHRPDEDAAVPTEVLLRHRRPSPDDIDTRLLELLLEIDRGCDGSVEDRERFARSLERFRRVWRGTWALHGEGSGGDPDFRRAVDALSRQVLPLLGRLRITSNGMDAVDLLRGRLPQGLGGSTPVVSESAASGPVRSFDRPIVIVAAPRSGSTLLFETLGRHPDLWTVGGESHGIIEGIGPLHPRFRDFDSNRLVAADATAEIADELRARFSNRLVDSEQRRIHATLGAPQRIRFLEKTPKNALRIPFLNRVFPDARFVFLVRDPAENISSIIEAWKSGRFVTYPRLPSWTGAPWSLLLVPGWRELVGKPLERIACAQWCSANGYIASDLAELGRERFTVVRYGDLVRSPGQVVRQICEFAGLSFPESLSQSLGDSLPLSKFTLTPPAADKWRQLNGDAVERVLGGTDDVVERLQRLEAGA